MISSKWIIAVFLSAPPFYTHFLSGRQAHTHLRDNGKSARKSPQCPTRILTLGEREFECVFVRKRQWEDEGERWGGKTAERKGVEGDGETERDGDSDVGSIATQKWSFFSPLFSLSLTLRGAWPMTTCVLAMHDILRLFVRQIICLARTHIHRHAEAHRYA